MIYMLNANARYIPLADRSVQMIATSPPYYGLRSYHTEPQIWPNGEKPCAAGEHEWGDNIIKAMSGGPSDKQMSNRGSWYIGESNTCHHCGAWRGELGLEPSPDLYVAHIVEIARELWRVLKDDGVFWLNLGDSYAGGGGYYPDAPSNRDGQSLSSQQDAGSGSKPKGKRVVNGLKPKDLCMIPARVAIALQADGWYLRSEIVWHKPNPMPESVRDRPTRAHEMIYLLTKSARYFYDAKAIAEPYADSSIDRFNYDFNVYAEKGDPTGEILGRKIDPHGGLKNSKGKDTSKGRNRRDVWMLATDAFAGSHFATWPQALVEPMILAGSRRGDIVLDPFAGSGTTLRVALQHGRHAIGLDLNPDYIELQNERTSKVQINLPLG